VKYIFKDSLVKVTCSFGSNVTDFLFHVLEYNWGDSSALISDEIFLRKNAKIFNPVKPNGSHVPPRITENFAFHLHTL